MKTVNAHLWIQFKSLMNWSSKRDLSYVIENDPAVIISNDVFIRDGQFQYILETEIKNESWKSGIRIGNEQMFIKSNLAI